MAMMVDQRLERAKAIVLPPAPPNMSMMVVLEESVVRARSEAT